MMSTSRRTGFTLVELLVAISILALVAILGWRGLDGITRSRQTLTNQLEQSRGMQLAFAQMQSDLEHLAGADLLVQRKNLSADTNSLTLVRTVFADNEAARVQVVSYRARDGQLLRRESIATRDLAQLDAMWQAALGDGDTTAPVILQNDIAGMGVRFWQGNAWTVPSGASSVATPGSTNVNLPVPVPTTTGNTPTGVEVTLHPRDQTGDLVKTFLLGPV
jgi:general secretion pathway protein J